MSSSVDSYANGIYNRFQHHAAWPPNTTLRIGDIGTLEGHLFQYRSNLKTMGIHFGINPASPPIDLEHSSGYTFALNPSISGQATAAGSVGIEAKAQISFDSGGAFVFQAMECRHYEIADKFRLATELTRLYVEKLWGKDWVVIESLYEAKKATIIVANSKGGHLEISANAGFPAGSVPLVRAQGALTVTSQSGDFTTYLAEQGLTPMFRLYRVKPSWLKRIRDVIAPVSEEADVLEPA